MRPFVVELGVEEIPSLYLPTLIADLRAKFTAAVIRERLATGALTVDGTPRRLAAWGTVAPEQTPERRRLSGPPLAVAYREGIPMPAAVGFARRAGVDVATLESDGERVVATVDAAVEPAGAVLARLLPTVLHGLEAPRPMRWRDDDVTFVRPVRWLVAILGDDVLPVSAFGIAAGRCTWGNRTDHPDAVSLARADEYAERLPQIGVMVSSAQRRQVVAAGAHELAAEVGGQADHPGVVEEVADLVEWPTVFRGRFDTALLDVPAAILASAMVHHQRYLPVTADGALLPYFIGARNGVGEALDAVVAGNERVLAARLADAAFFYAADRETTESERRQRLSGMTYREGLGSYEDKTERLVASATAWGERLGLSGAEHTALVRAASLAKLDLVTHVVGEFPELEGVMGGVYAEAAGEPALSAAAIAGQYQPRTAADPLPPGRVDRALSLLDHLDDLAGGVALGVAVTGSSDPFGQRRAALAVGRILVEGGLAPVDQRELLADALARVGVADPAPGVKSLVSLIESRLKSWLDAGVPADVLDAALAAPSDWASLTERLAMLRRFAATPSWGRVATAAKRVGRLSPGVDPAPAGSEGHPEPTAAALAGQLAALRAAPPPWEAWPAAAESLVDPVAQFFDAVMVMDPDPAVRARRLGLVAAVSAWLHGPVDWTRVTSLPAAGATSGGAG